MSTNIAFPPILNEIGKIQKHFREQCEQKKNVCKI
jgi:hypothetical protein